MNKKLMTTALAGAIFFTGINFVQAAEDNKTPMKPPVKQEMKSRPPMAAHHGQSKADMEKRVQEFNKTLGLTDAQIRKAKQLRMKSHQAMRPLIERKRAKMEELREIKKNESMTDLNKQRKVEELRKEIREIDAKANNIRKNNEKAFEAILTPEQKAKYAQIKEDGRKHFKEHKKPQGPENFNHKQPYKTDGKTEFKPSSGEFKPAFKNEGKTK